MVDKKGVFRRFFQVALLFLVCFMLAESAVRVYLRFNRIYDVEMARYSMEVKQDAPDPGIGHAHKPNVTATLMGCKVRTNSDGLRDREHSFRHGIEKRIIFLGDSLTFGWGVEERDIFKSILEDRLNRLSPTEIINFGTGNYNTEQEVHHFLQKGLKYEPDQVVVFYFINDAELTPKKSSWWFLGYSRLITLYWSRIHILAEKFMPSEGYQSRYSRLYEDKQPGLVRTKKAFLLLKDECRKHRIALQVVLLPELHSLKNYPFKKEHRLMVDFLKAHKVECLDLAASFSGQDNPRDLWVALDDAHPNEKAHRLIAQYALDFIKGPGKAEKNDQSIS